MVPPPIPTGREDRGGDDTVRSHSTGEEASGLGTSEQVIKRGERWLQGHIPSRE